MGDPIHGHGHVVPRLDGGRMRCGGPGICDKCSAEKIQHDREKKEFTDEVLKPEPSKTQSDWWYSQEDFVTDEGLPAWELANRKLKAERDKAPVVYMMPAQATSGDADVWTKDKTAQDTHCARLEGIEKLK